MKGGADTHRKAGEPHGSQWESLRRQLWRRWRAQGAVCWHCLDPDPDQIEHLISYQRRPDLAMAESNLAPTHSVCPHCGLSCNTLAASNSAERDAQGRSVPFSPAYKARKVAELAAKGRQPGPKGGFRGDPGKSPGPRPATVGREW